MRAAGYTGVKKEISVWDAVVHSRRAADQVLVVTLVSFLHKGRCQKKTEFIWDFVPNYG